MSTVSWTTNDGLATLRMEREHGNAIDATLMRDLLAAMRETARDSEVRGVLWTSGGKLFCPGLDLIDLVERDRAYLSEFLRDFHACLLALYTYPKPLVVALAGHALAGGCILALSADWRVLQRGSVVGLNEIRAGLALPFDVAEILRASVPPHRLEEVALLGRNYTNDDALATGLVHEIHDAAGFEAHCLARLEGFASRDLGAFARTKQYLRAPAVERIQAQGAGRDDEFLDGWFSDSARRRVREIVAELRNRAR